MQDEHAGEGGSFRLGKDGERALVQRTGPEIRSEPEAPTEIAAPAGPVEVDAVLSAPAKSGKADKAQQEKKDE